MLNCMQLLIVNHSSTLTTKENIIVFRGIMCILYLEMKNYRKSARRCRSLQPPEASYKYARWQSSLSKQQRKKNVLKRSLCHSSSSLLESFHSIWCLPCVKMISSLPHKNTTQRKKNCFKYPRKFQFFSQSSTDGFACLRAAMEEEPSILDLILCMGSIAPARLSEYRTSFAYFSRPHSHSQRRFSVQFRWVF